MSKNGKRMIDDVLDMEFKSPLIQEEIRRELMEAQKFSYSPKAKADNVTLIQDRSEDYGKKPDSSYCTWIEGQMIHSKYSCECKRG